MNKMICNYALNVKRQLVYVLKGHEGSVGGHFGSVGVKKVTLRIKSCGVRGVQKRKSGEDLSERFGDGFNEKNGFWLGKRFSERQTERLDDKLGRLYT